MALDVAEAIISPARARRLTTRVVTNGTLLDDKRVKRLVDAGLDGVKVTFSTTQDERLAALVKGTRADEPQRLLANIERAKAAGLWVFVRMGVGRHNSDEMASIFHLMKSIGVDVLQFKPWIPSGFAATNQDQLSLSKGGLVTAFSEFVAECYDDFDPSMEVTVSCYPPAREMGLDVKDCANIAKLYCEPDGQVTVCNFASEWLGNWKDPDGLVASVRRRREHYDRMMDAHGVASCPARYNWSSPQGVVSERPESDPVTGPGPVPVTLSRSR